MRSLSAIPALPPKALALAVACLLAGGTAAAQTPQADRIWNTEAAGSEADTRVLPIWNASSGRFEALLLLSPQQGDARPSDWLLSRDQVLPGVGLRSTQENGSRLSGSLHLDNNAGLALLCSQGIHVAMSLGALGEQCLLAEVSSPNDPLMLRGSTPGAVLDARWQSPEGALDLSFGLSWLHTSLDRASESMLPALAPATTAVSGLPTLAMGDIDLRQVHWNSSLNLSGQRWVSLGGAFGTQELVTLFGGPVHWDSATVTLGVGYRGLSGRLTGRLIELPEGNGNWTGLDLGFSWRTPWHGELSFGAQNLLNRTPDTSKWPLHELPAIEAPGGRTPYVRYKQDL